MGHEQSQTVFSLQVVEFTTVAKEFCLFLERAGSFESHDFIVKLHRFLALLYVKALAAGNPDPATDEGCEKFVTEVDWVIIRDNVNTHLGAHDAYLDFFDHLMHETPEPVTCTVSENVADIYQDLKDFITNYQLGIEEVMADALHECMQQFRQYWGQRLTATLRHLHHVLYVEGIESERE